MQITIENQTVEDESGTSFLFTFAFDVAFCYLIVRSGSSDFRLAPESFFLWISAQWFQAFAILITISRKSPRLALAPVIAIYSLVAAGLLAFRFLLPEVELLLVTGHRGAYLGFNAAALTAFYGIMLMRLRRNRRELPGYFAARTVVSIAFSIVACVGIVLTVDSGPAPVFAFYFCRFVSLALCYNANVTFTLLSPYRSLHGQAAARADQLSAANDRLGAALAEREILLGEIHHRVKNNLQVVSSLLSLQAFRHEDAGFREGIENSQNRIRAMALVHEMLYQHKDFTSIDFSEYLRRIVGELFNSTERPEVRSVVDCESLSVPIDSAITCGLIVNELVTNCMKHAFPDGRPGTVTVRLRSEGSWATLSVEDDGVGLPPGLDIGSLRSMGLSLLASLASQLRGDYAIEEGEGTRITIRFPRQAPAPI